MKISIIERPANGATAHLGAIYNAQTNAFTGVNILKEQGRLQFAKEILIPSSGFQLLQAPAVGLRDDDLVKMLIASLPTVVNCDESGQLQSTGTQSTRTARQSLTYTCRKVKESIDFFDKRVQAFLWNVTLAARHGTHVLFQIVWGADLTMSWTKHHGSQGLGNIEYQYSGLEFSNELPPTSPQEFLDLVGKATCLMSNCNGGKGAQQLFRFIPIKQVLAYIIASDPSAIANNPMAGVGAAKSILGKTFRQMKKVGDMKKLVPFPDK